MIEKQLSARQVGEILGVSSSTVRRRLPEFAGWWFDGFAIRIPESSVAKYIEARQLAASQPTPIPIRRTFTSRDADGFSRAIRRYRDQVCGVRVRSGKRKAGA